MMNLASKGETLSLYSLLNVKPVSAEKYIVWSPIHINLAEGITQFSQTIRLPIYHVTLIV